MGRRWHNDGRCDAGRDFGPFLANACMRTLLAMIQPEVVKRVFQAIAAAHPEEGHFTVHRVDIRRGWGNLLNVTIHADAGGTASDSATLSAAGQAIRKSVEHALGPERSRVSLVEIS